MSRPRLPHLPQPWPLALAFVLGALTLALWLSVLLRHSPGISIANHSAQVVSGVQLCLPSGECQTRRLWPHQVWRLPAQAGEVRLSTAGQQLEAHLTPQTGMHFVFREGGRVTLAD